MASDIEVVRVVDAFFVCYQRPVKPHISINRNQSALKARPEVQRGMRASSNFFSKSDDAPELRLDGL